MSPDPSKILTARLAEWDATRGYGFLQVSKKRVFLHRRDFAELDRQPVVGEEIRFIMGKDAKGRQCAKEAVFVISRRSPGIWRPILLISLLVMPSIALIRAGGDNRWIFGYLAVINLVTYKVYAMDKRSARAGAWRVAEGKLHLLELLGGWPGAYIAQNNLRHKCSKGSYQFIFWLIVIGYQLAAIDSMQDWRVSEALFALISN